MFYFGRLASDSMHTDSSRLQLPAAASNALPNKENSLSAVVSTKLHDG
jgi:hypothetical protein